MVLRIFLSLVLSTLAAAASIAACSSPNDGAGPGDTEGGDPDGATCIAYAPPSNFNPSEPVVSFSVDVFPIFTASCAFSSCHGSTTAPQGGLVLGSDPARVYANLVGVASSEFPAMLRVKAGDPASSYLLYRLDGDACTLAGCTTVACYELMPQSSPAIAETERLAIRGWIAQGALSDLPDAGPASDASQPESD
jgi:hypothetical protein